MNISAGWCISIASILLGGVSLLSVSIFHVYILHSFDGFLFSLGVHFWSFVGHMLERGLDFDSVCSRWYGMRWIGAWQGSQFQDLRLPTLAFSGSFDPARARTS